MFGEVRDDSDGLGNGLESGVSLEAILFGEHFERKKKVICFVGGAFCVVLCFPPKLLLFSVEWKKSERKGWFERCST